MSKKKDKPDTEECSANDVASTSNDTNLNINGDDSSPEKKREDTRSKIAQVYVYAFYCTILATFLVGLYKGFSVDEYSDLLVTISGILSGPLGFIIGFYFKSSSSKSE